MVNKKDKKEDYLQDVKPEDINSQNMRLVADTCGIEVAIKLMQELSGILVYIPTVQKGLTPAIIRSLKKKYDGSRDSLNKLARESGINANRLYSLLNDSKKQ